jgi:hypothetical protein
VVEYFKEDRLPNRLGIWSSLVVSGLVASNVVMEDVFLCFPREDPWNLILVLYTTFPSRDVTVWPCMDGGNVPPLTVIARKRVDAWDVPDVDGRDGQKLAWMPVETDCHWFFPAHHYYCSSSKTTVVKLPKWYPH